MQNYTVIFSAAQLELINKALAHYKQTAQAATQNEEMEMLLDFTNAKSEFYPHNTQDIFSAVN